MPAGDADRVARAIVLHMAPDVTLEDGVESVLLDRATGLDVRGAGYDLVNAVRPAVVRAFPRGAFDRHFLAAMSREAASRPGCQSARLVNEVGLASWMATSPWRRADDGGPDRSAVGSGDHAGRRCDTPAMTGAPHAPERNRTRPHARQRPPDARSRAGVPVLSTTPPDRRGRPPAGRRDRSRHAADPAVPRPPRPHRRRGRRRRRHDAVRRPARASTASRWSCRRGRSLA